MPCPILPQARDREHRADEVQSISMIQRIRTGSCTQDQWRGTTGFRIILFVTEQAQADARWPCVPHRAALQWSVQSRGSETTDLSAR
jgi:hypothetical protein